MAISNEEAKKLLYYENPVYFNGVKYKKINGLIYRKSEGRFKASAELLDMNHHCVVICPLEWIDASEEEKIELLGQEEAETLAIKCQEEMTALINYVGQNKPEESLDSLHRLLSNLMKLDNKLLNQLNQAALTEEYKDDTKKGLEEMTNKLAETFSLGGLDEEEGKEKIPQRKEERAWKAN